MRKNILPIITLILSINKLYGQNDHSIIFPPTPEVASIGKFIDQPMTLSRGIPDITIPITTLQ
ncbi:hypothetical protein [Chryseobacterium elymi]|uniref:hypothetical protein n=1 Tax=Chryseobacterium elymi TaxID=395936 RepID=UPI000F4D34C3|nr:hypothetical protein [Chryseobacterium elymi]